REPLALINLKKKNEETGEEELASRLDHCKAKATRHIFLIRHSQYNLDGRADKDRTLTPLGREQAELTGHRLASLGLKFDQIIHSSMTRATETTEIISKHLPGVKKISTDLLREGAPIEPDPPVSHWKPEAVYYEDGARIEAAFRNFIHRADAKQEEDSYEIFVCHANVIRYIVCRALQFPPEGWLRLSLNNGSITHLVIRPNGRVALRTLGDTGKRLVWEQPCITLQLKQKLNGFMGSCSNWEIATSWATGYHANILQTRPLRNGESYPVFGCIRLIGFAC
ncbi:Serine/threonine-protein phosphatase PGAM5, partial [Lamprotornis superbus]